jgi:hypothetical protein
MPNAGEKRSKLKVMLDFLKRLLGRKPAAPGDPYAYVMAPVRRGPKGRSGAAVAEIEDDSFRSFRLAASVFGMKLEPKDDSSREPVVAAAAE